MKSTAKLTKLFQWYIERLPNGTYTLRNQLYNENYASHTLLGSTSDKATVSSTWHPKPKQWRIDPSDLEGSYVYVPLQTFS
jgi:hypothetical protein